MVAITSETKPIRFNQAWAGLGPRLDERGPAGHEERGHAGTDRDLSEPKDVALGHESPTAPQPLTKRPDGRHAGQSDSGDEADATGDGQANLIAGHAERNAQRAKGDSSNSGHP